MRESNTDFNWTIDEGKTWPPRGRPSAPFGPTILDVLRSCPLRGCFESSIGYERRTGYAARVGTALHRTLQSLTESPPRGESEAEKIQEARHRFLHELDAQELEIEKRPRERGLPKDVNRVSLAIEKVMTEALYLIRASKEPSPVEKSTGAGMLPFSIQEADELSAEREQAVLVESEVPVKSKDGLLYGRIDLVEHRSEGIHLVDYKFALRDDLPERYERQLQLYALLWYECRGKWPESAEIVYPLIGSSYPVSVAPETCQRVGAEARNLISSLQRTALDQLATPGDICSVCEFRPWCKAFWHWQANETSPLTALRRATLGFEGDIVNIEAKDFHWKLLVRWRNCIIRITAPTERFPQLRQAAIGMRVRALDMRLHGQQPRPQAIVTEVSELYLLAN